MSAASTYLLDNANDKAGTRMDVLARLYDATTQRVLERVGHRRPAGTASRSAAAAAAWRAGWRNASGAQGSVLCTDIDTRIIEGRRGRTPAKPRSAASRHRAAIRCRRCGLRPGACAAGADPRAAARARAGAHGRGAQTRRLAGHRGFRLGFGAAGRGRQPLRNAAAAPPRPCAIPHARTRTAISAGACTAASASWGWRGVRRGAHDDVRPLQRRRRSHARELRADRRGCHCGRTASRGSRSMPTWPRSNAKSSRCRRPIMWSVIGKKARAAGTAIGGWLANQPGGAGAGQRPAGPRRIARRAPSRRCRLTTPRRQWSPCRAAGWCA